jgi:hypothetical protein
VWLDPGGAPRVVAPADARFQATGDGALVARALASGTSARTDGDVPVAIPLLLDGRPVGAIEIRELVPQVARLGRLQEELLGFLSDRLAPAMCSAGLLARQAAGAAWEAAVGEIDAIDLRRPG